MQNYLFCDLIFFSIDGHQLGVLCVLVSIGAPYTVYHHLQTHNEHQRPQFLSVSFPGANSPLRVCFSSGLNNLTVVTQTRVQHKCLAQTKNRIGFYDAEPTEKDQKNPPTVAVPLLHPGRCRESIWWKTSGRSRRIMPTPFMTIFMKLVKWQVRQVCWVFFISIISLLLYSPSKECVVKPVVQWNVNHLTEVMLLSNWPTKTVCTGIG